MKSSLSTLIAIGLTVSAMASSPKPENPNSVIVHEWGTFTSIAGEDGKPITWTPWNGPSDLPCFVDRFKNNTKSSYAAKIRMETPVLYFYAQRPTRVDVNVRFRQGLITEWYPRAAVTPDQYRDQVADPSFTSTITWNDVKIRPETSPQLLREAGASHYYAARATDASALESGTQHEKFLFYRGIGNFDVPITATIERDGGIVVSNPDGEPIPDLLLFENRGGRIRFRSAGPTNDRTVVALPSFPSDVASLRQELKRELTNAGLFEKEAEAMVETWRDSWFEEGARLFYVVPQSMVDRVLPLEVSPAPARTVRVFVGRVELMTPLTMETIERAIHEGDTVTLEKYGRFLEPVRNRIVARMSAADRRSAEMLLQSVASSYFNRTASLCR